jgi:hypothetical protein
MSLKLDKIQMVKASCLSFSVKNKAAEEIRGFIFDYKTETKADAENKLVFIQLKVEISGKLSEKEGQVNLGNFEFGFVYRVENLDELIQLEDDHRYLDTMLQMSLLGISFSTARGIILTKAANTAISDAYLPILNPALLLGEKTEI